MNNSKGTSAIYQRIPNHHLAPFVGKAPQSISIMNVPPIPKGQTMSFWAGAAGKWEVLTLAVGTTLEEALDRVESINVSSKRLLKVRVNFPDGTHLLLTRTNWSDAGSLSSKEAYSPHHYVEKMVAGKRNPPTNLEPLVNASGHMLQRPRSPGGSAKNHSLRGTLPPDLEMTGRAGFSFTPVGYNSRAAN